MTDPVLRAARSDRKTAHIDYRFWIPLEIAVSVRPRPCFQFWYDKDGQIVLENYGSQPVRLGSVKRDDKAYSVR